MGCFPYKNFSNHVFCPDLGVIREVIDNLPADQLLCGGSLTLYKVKGSESSEQLHLVHQPGDSAVGLPNLGRAQRVKRPTMLPPMETAAGPCTGSTSITGSLNM